MIRKQSIINIAVVSLLIVVVGISSSCSAANRTNLVKSGVVNIEKERTGKAYIAWSSAYEENGELVIIGSLRRSDRVGSSIKTHVDVEIVSANGTVQSKARSSAIAVSKRIKGRSYQGFERFEIRMAGVPAKGSVIRLVSHSGRHD